jgi:hypothetical protein
MCYIGIANSLLLNVRSPFVWECETVELHIRCQYGQKRKDGKVVRSGKCPNRAHGIYRVYPVRGKPKAYALCAECAFDKVPNHKVCIMPGPNAPANAEPMFVRDVASVELLASLNTDFDQGKSTNLAGAKHWVEPTTPPKPEVESAYTIKRTKSRRPDMDMQAYRNSLSRHDDGK